ncbi:MAG: hypothetical protein LBF12_01550 [Christensenellaceae bacterium]|jgi:hypothetical protein|nr:hypothetical protein [Christensenellaceae bacterium]
MTVKIRQTLLTFLLCAIFITAVLLVIVTTDNFAIAEKTPYPGLTFPTASTTTTLTYSPTLQLSSIELIGGSTEAGTFAWVYPDTIPTCNIELYEVKFTPTDTEYQTATASVTVKIKQATPANITFPTVQTTHLYEPARKLSDIHLNNGSGDGTFEWHNGANELLTVGTKLYTINFKPRDAINYNYTDVVMSNQRSITITPAEGQVNFPTLLEIFYQPGKTLADIDIATQATSDSGKVGGNGTFYWKYPTTQISTALTQSTVVFTPDPNYYFSEQSFERTISVTIKKAAPPATTFPTTDPITYSPTRQLSQITLRNGVGDGTFEWKNPTTIPTTTVPSYLVVFVPRDPNNYDYSTITCEQNVTLTVLKATPQNLTFPATPSEITYAPDRSLSSISFSGGSGDGTFAWEYPDMIPIVTMSSYKIIFMPRDAINYDYSNITLELAVELSVLKARPSGVVFPTAEAVTYNPSSTLASVPFVRASGTGDGAFSWATPTIVPSSSVSLYQVKFTPTDSNNYESLYEMITIQVAKLNLKTLDSNGVVFPSTLPTIQYNPNNTLANVSITGTSTLYTGSFNWSSPNIIPSVNVREYDAKFTPDDANIIGLTQKIQIVITKALATACPLPADLTTTYTYSHNLKLEEITFVNDSEGLFAWKDPFINPFVNNNGYIVQFVPFELSNYDYSNIDSLEFIISPIIIPRVLLPSEYEIPTGLKATYGSTLSDIELPEGFQWELPGNTQVGAVGEHAFSVSYHPSVNPENYVTATNIALTITVDKAINVDKPDISTIKIAKKNGNSLVFESSQPVEYSIDGGNTWQSSPKFDDLTPQKEYTVLVRLKEDESYLASSNWQAITIKTPMSTLLAIAIVIAGFALATGIFAIIYKLCIKPKAHYKTQK